ncbi:MAG: peptidase M14 [Bacteroidetes bacterium]|nr:peptidase M14 [Bacteroidota bacterium]
MRTSRLFLGLLLLAPSLYFAVAQEDWRTDYERSGGERTPRYAETIAYCRRLASASPWARYSTFGMSPQNRPLPLLIVSTTGAFTPADAERGNQAVVLIQAGIHAGEIDGKDAGLMLLRDILILKKDVALLDSVVLLFVPIFNVDGHERFGPYNRINQNGPAEMGWRTTAQRLNLNRDYMKADAPEMRAMLRLFNEWLPDLYIDCHVTDGIDMQYDVTYATELGPNLDRRIVRWVENSYLPPVLKAVESAGHPIFWYVFPREELDLSKGMGGGSAPPRFSTGYAALHNRPSLLIETHMLKPYRTRVDATYHLLRASLEAVSRNASQLRWVVRAADRDRTTYREETTLHVGLKHGLDSSYTKRRFKGIRHRIESGGVSGSPHIMYTGEPYELDIPFYDRIVVTDSVAVPAAYIIPPEWQRIPEVLAVHGITFRQTVQAETLSVEATRFSDIRFPVKPYEGRQTASYKTRQFKTRLLFPAGSIVVPMNQRASHVAVHLLEPRSEDSFAAWGFFNSIFEQKEYAEDYVMESVGKSMLQADPELRAEFVGLIASDTSFARSASRRLNWLYLHSLWADSAMNVYPVGRLNAETLKGLRTAEFKKP